MYKVMLVDDEILVRERISKRIPWEELGYCLAAVCENGKEAIEFLQTEDVDLILTDICMPYVDGLGLAKYVYEEKKKAKVIILSGYDEFSYAKEALKYQALSYILKPVTAAELSEALAEAKAGLDERKAEGQAKSAYQDGLEILKWQLLLKLAAGKMTEEEWDIKCREYGIHFTGERYCAVSVFVGGSPEEGGMIQLIRQATAISQDILAFEGLPGNLTLFVKGDNNKQLREEARRVCQELAAYARRQGFCLNCFIGNCVAELSSTCISCQNAFSMQEFVYLEKGGGIYEWDSYQKHKWDVAQAFRNKEREQRMVLAVRSNLKDEVKRELQEFQAECREKWIAKSRAVIIIQGMIFAVVADVSQINLEEDGELLWKEQECLSALFQCSYLSEMAETVLGFFEDAVDAVNYNRADYGNRQAALALDYIQKNYADPELSLGALCQKYAISISYFSVVFKEYAGKTFIEALTEQRMSRAKELMESQPLKMYEIAEKCGYKDAGYFGVAFKKYYGMSPREYLKVCKKGT